MHHEATGPAEAPGDAIAAAPRPAAGQVDATLDHLTRLCGRLEQAEARFKHLTDECEGVLQSLVAVDRRHSSVVAGLNERLGDWCHLEGKLLEESARRIEQFERGVSHEWMVIRQLHEEPIAALKDQADQLRLTCLEAARLARFRLDSAEQAYTAYTADLERRMAEWSRELLKASRTHAITDGAGDPSGAGSNLAAGASAEPWPLEGVAQLHQELRTRGGQAGQLPLHVNGSPAEAGSHRAQPGSPGQGAAAAAPGADLSGRGRTASRGEAGMEPAIDPDQASRPRRAAWIAATTFAAIAVLALGGYAIRSRSSSSTPARSAPAAAQAESAAAGSAKAAQTDRTLPPEDDRLAEAQRAAERAGAMVEILASPDLRRYALAGVSQSGAPQPYGQVLWSRSRGLAASASRLPALAGGKVFHLWIVPDGPPISAGVLVPDAAGRASLLIGGPLKLPLPVTIRVTIEDRGEVTSPRGPVCLARVPTT
jgi:hypothetical protein